MSGLEDQANKVALGTCLENIIQKSKESLNAIMKIRQSIYGPNDVNFENILSKIENDLKTFWENEIEVEKDRERNLSNDIEQMGKQALELEKALGLGQGVNKINDDLPLVELENQLWELLDSYKKMKEKRISEYTVLRLKEEELCAILNENPQIHDCFKPSVNASSEVKSSPVKVPTSDDMLRCNERLKELEHLQDQLEYDFTQYKHELAQLLKECDILPFHKLERFACGVEEIDFAITKQNLDKLKGATEEYRTKKEHMIAEADQLRHDIRVLSRKMLKDEDELNLLLNDYTGFTKPTLVKLKDLLAQLKEERKHKLKELILNHRDLLDDLWNLCCYTDDQKSEFRAYYVDYYSEEVLNFHELEVEKLQDFYEAHKQIFELAEKHKELWNKMLQLEEKASNVNRLFNNRGGQLLQEEKERKLIQKKVPAIEAKLTELLNEYKANNGKAFLHFGVPLQETLQHLQREREQLKESKKLQRKVANTENILLESKLGARPITGAKRKHPPMTPISPPKMSKMDVHSTMCTMLTASSKSDRSQKVIREVDLPSSMRRGERLPGCIGGRGGQYATPRTPRRTAPSTPENGAH